MNNPQKHRTNKFLILAIILLFPSVAYLIFFSAQHHVQRVPVFYPVDVKKTIVNGEETVDTIYHTIPPFTFVNHLGDTVTEKNFEEKIYVANFFFATCRGICPKMSTQMLRVQEKFKDSQSLRLISHTVDPERDTVEALANYAEAVHANPGIWHFITGKKENIYSLAENGYFVTAMDNKPGLSTDSMKALNAEQGPEEFIHSEKFILVDKEKRIRGYYDGTSTAEVNKLLEDIRMLINEYEAEGMAEKKIIFDRKK
jgi:protein SCO1/2